MPSPPLATKSVPPPPATSSERIRRALVLVALAAPVLIYFSWVARVAVNIPFWDDFGLYLMFITKFKMTPAFWEKMELVVAVHNEHRLIFPRLVSLAQYYLSNELNFVALIFIGNLSLLVLCGLLWRHFVKQGLYYAYFIPVPYLLFSFSSWENMAWATCAMQHSFFMLFASATVLSLTSLGLQLGYGYLIFLLLACATSGGGICLIPVVGLYLLCTKNWRNLLVFGLVALLLLGLYYHPSRHHPPLNELLNNRCDCRSFPWPFSAVTRQTCPALLRLAGLYRCCTCI